MSETLCQDFVISHIFNDSIGGFFDFAAAGFQASPK